MIYSSQSLYYYRQRKDNFSPYTDHQPTLKIPPSYLIHMSKGGLFNKLFSIILLGIRY